MDLTAWTSTDRENVKYISVPAQGDKVTVGRLRAFLPPLPVQEWDTYPSSTPRLRNVTRLQCRLWWVEMGAGDG
jgi:hypothetical protein